MATHTKDRTDAVRAHVTGPAAEAVPELIRTLRAELADPALVLYFASSAYEPDEVAGPIAEAFDGAVVAGCSTAGEFTDRSNATEGISAIALPSSVVGTVTAGMGELRPDPEHGTRAAVAEVESALGRPLRSLEAGKALGFVLIDGMSDAEERVNAELANAAPLLDIVGGSAGDDLAFKKTWVTLHGRVSWSGVVLIMCEVRAPFHIIKSCSFRPMERTLRVTRADLVSRTVHEIDGRPALEAYAAALGLQPHEVTEQTLFEHPLGLMIDGKPWIRSPRTVNADGSISFYAQVLEGCDVELMSATDLVGDTRSSMMSAVEAAGGAASGAVLFNCVLRRLQIDHENTGEQFVDSLAGVPSAGFHTYGETWLGHVNQTITGVVFGKPDNTNA